MSNATKHSPKPGQASSSSLVTGIPILACAYALIVSPLLLFLTYSPSSVLGTSEIRNENKLFWPAVAVAAVLFAAHALSRGAKIVWARHILCLLAYLALAGTSMLWAFSPTLSLTRYSQQVMIVAATVLPAMVTVRSVDLMRGLFLCFGLAAVLNVCFVAGGYETIADNIAIGFSGYFTGKNYLGQCAAIALLLALHEALYPGRRRWAGVFIGIISVFLIFYSNSKTAFGLAILTPALAALFLIARKTMRISPAVIVWGIVLGYFILSQATGFNMNRVSYILYGDSSFTGRQVIWNFANLEIARKPFLGWGYQSFWLVGPGGPSLVDGPGWVKMMPNSHNGYYDVILELGYVGFAILLAFITATLHGIGRAMDRNPVRGFALLSLALFIIIYNGLESAWLRGFEFMWLVFLIIVAEVAKYGQPYRVEERSLNSRHRNSGPNRQHQLAETRTG